MRPPLTFRALFAGIACAAGIGAEPTGADSVPVAQLVWPWETAGWLWEADAAMRRRIGSLGTAWPAALSRLCADAWSAGHDGDDEASRRLRKECRARAASPPVSVTVAAALHPLGRRYPLGATFESFGGDWESWKVDPELAGAWADHPPLGIFDAGYPITPHTFARFRFAARRDLRAWHRDPLGGNLPLSASEIDLNEPSFGYFHAESGPLALTVGRQPIHWSPSPEYGLALSRSVPFHDAIQAFLGTPVMRYRFLVSSLNPWLQGTPLSDSSGTDYPPGSEEYRQRHYPHEGSVNAQRRVYDERAKTLLGHRLEFAVGRLEAGLTELAIIGGKRPDLQDANPFAFFHNNFRHGYTNTCLSLDARIRLPAGLAVGGELLLDDLVWGSTETRRTSASLMGTLAFASHAFRAGDWLIRHSLHWIRTDPFLYGAYQPYNTFYARRVLSSNLQEDDDPAFVDRYVVDHPIGYARGGDASDFRYRLEAASGGPWTAALDIGFLASGEADAYAPFDTRGDTGSSPSGTAEREIRLAASTGAGLSRGVRIAGGAAWQGTRHSLHQRGVDATHLQAGVSLVWTWPH